MKSIDFIGPVINLKLEGKRNFKSYFGSCISLLIMIASMILFFIFGKNLFYKTTPNVSSSHIFNKNSRVNMKNYTIPIRFYKSDTSILTNPLDYFTIKSYRQVTVNGKTTYAKTTLIIKFLNVKKSILKVGEVKYQMKL